MAVRSNITVQDLSIVCILGAVVLLKSEFILLSKNNREVPVGRVGSLNDGATGRGTEGKPPPKNDAGRTMACEAWGVKELHVMESGVGEGVVDI